MFQTMDVDEEDSQLVQHRYIESAFTRPPVYDAIFSCCSPGDFIRFGRTCHTARGAMYNFSSRAFNINRHLLRFFPNPIDFRSLQARTGTLISGSNALQFLDRTFYPESDLDLYTHPGHSREVGLWLIRWAGYKFAPNSSQAPNFDALVTDDWDGLARRYDAETDVDLVHGQKYRMVGIGAIYTFTKDDGIVGVPPIKVQIIEAETNPLQCVLGFHSLCVMNVISYNAAYCLYPRATFEERRTLAMSVSTDGEAEALSKYAIRGWRIQYDVFAHEEGKPQSSFYMHQTRWVDDKRSWVIPLDVTGVIKRPPPSLTSSTFTWDPVEQNSWKLARSEGGKLLMTYFTAKSTLFRYNYLVAERQFMTDYLMVFIKSQGRLERTKRKLLSAEEQRTSATWWDSEIAGFRETYLEKALQKRKRLRQN